MGSPALPKLEDLGIESLAQQIFNEFREFYTAHFRAEGLVFSIADQMAFYEIAQPALRDLALRAQGRSSSGL